jgi:HPt (histidine-containing phosphotransfer) domain-containing protein
MLVTLIRNAATELREAVTRVSDLVQQRPIDRKTLLFELHSLAGSSANIGAETIARAARDLEFHFKRGASEPSAALQQAYEDAAREFLDSLAQITVLSEERAVQHGSSVDPAERASLARQLYGQLKGNRGSSLQTCYAMRELFAGVSDMDKLERQVKRFDFKNAMATLKDIAVMSGITLEE